MYTYIREGQDITWELPMACTRMYSNVSPRTDIAIPHRPSKTFGQFLHAYLQDVHIALSLHIVTLSRLKAFLTKTSTSC